MTGNAVNAKSEALELHELSSEELNPVSGGFFLSFFKTAEDKKQSDAIKAFQALLQEI